MTEICLEQFQPQIKKILTHQALNPEPAAYDSSALTATLRTCGRPLHNCGKV